MADIFIKLLNMSISASYFVIAVIILRMFLKRSPRWVNLALWGLVAFRLAIPFNFKSVLSLIPSTQTVVRPSSVSRIEIHSGFNAFDKGANNFIAEAVPIPQITAPAADVPIAAAKAPVDIMGIMGYIWLLGFVFIIVFSFISFLKLKKNVDISVKIANGIYVCDYIDIPFILGIFSPRIYLPSSLNKEDVKYVVAHERAHLRNFHNIYKPLGFLLWAVYWFNPVMLLAYVLFSKDIELACDEEVIKNYSFQEKKAYSYALLSCSSPYKIISPCPLAFGEVGVKERVKKVMKYKKPKLLAVAMSLLLCLLSACFFLTDPKESTVSQSGAKPVEKENKNGATIRYPDMVPESVRTSKFYKEALKDKNAHISIDGRVASSPDAVIRFFNDAAEGREASFTHYAFSDKFIAGLYKSVYIYNGEKITEEVTGIIRTQNQESENPDFSDFEWGESYLHEVEYMYVSDIGNIHQHTIGSTAPSYFAFIDERDKFRDHEENQNIMNKYVSPVFPTLIFGESFENAEDFFRSCRYMPVADEMISYETGGKENYWERYTDANMPFDDFYALMSKYFEIDKNSLYSIVKNNLNEQDQLNYQGGFGGAYPDAVVEDMESQNDTTTIYIRYFNVDGSYSENQRSELKLKNMPDGSFKYLSLKDVECEKMEFGDYMNETLSKFKDRTIKTSENAVLKPMAQHDDVWWWDNYVYDLAYDTQTTYPAESAVINQNMEVYQLMLYAVRHNEAEIPKGKTEIKLKKDKADAIAQRALGKKDAKHLYLEHITDKYGNINYYVSAAYRRMSNSIEGKAGDDIFSITEVNYITPFVCQISLSDKRKMEFKQISNDEYVLSGVEAVMESREKSLEIKSDKKVSAVYAESEKESTFFNSLLYAGAHENQIVLYTEDSRLGLYEFCIYNGDDMKTPIKRFLAGLAYGENLIDASVDEKGNIIFATDHNIRKYDFDGKLLEIVELPKEYLDLTAKNMNDCSSGYIFDDSCNYMSFVYPEGLFAADLKNGKVSKVCDVEQTYLLLEGGYPMEIKDGVLIFADRRSIAPCLSNAKYYDIKTGKEIEAPYVIPTSDDEGIQFKYVIDDEYAIGEPHGMMNSKSDMEIYNIKTKKNIKVDRKNAHMYRNGNDVYLFGKRESTANALYDFVKVDLKTGSLSEPLFSINTVTYLDIDNGIVFVKPPSDINWNSSMAAIKL